MDSEVEIASANLIDWVDADTRAAVHFHHESGPRP